MGYFFAVTAIKTKDSTKLVETIKSYFEKYKVPIEAPSTTGFDDNNDISIYERPNGWYLIIWPQMFNIYDLPTCDFLTKDLDTIALNMHVYDSDYWSQFLIEKGEIIDQFASIPDYFTPDEAEKKKLFSEYSGNPETIGKTFNIDPSIVKSYYVHLDPEITYGKANTNDSFELDNWWVFTDLWEKLGFPYPNGAELESPLYRISLLEDLDKQLPYSSSDL